MKKIITSLVLVIAIAFSANLSAQNPHPFELGLNAGVSWLKSDVKMKRVGFGWGLTFGQTYCMNNTSPLLWGWRLRYLNANTYGQGYDKSFGIANNPVLNGTNDSLLDYSSSPGYVYQNYKTHLDELSLELVLGANKLRVQTGLYPYIFGGLGFTKAVTKTNQLDDNNMRYNYAMIDSAGITGKSGVLSAINDLQDGSYESLAEGSTSAKWKLMPSIGLGLGYEVVSGFSIGLEHKMTWGLNDVLDGQKWSNTNISTGNNDMYHYSSFWIKFSFGRGSHTHTTTTTTTTTPDTYTNTPVVAPVITFSNPATPGTTATEAAITIKGKISGINSASDMTMTVNGNPVAGFTYNAATDIFTYPIVLQSFATTIAVTATNAGGSNNETTTIIYNPVMEIPKAPVVTIGSPNQNPFLVPPAAGDRGYVSGNIMNITSQGQMQVTLNGVQIGSLGEVNYNTATHQFTIDCRLMPGANTFVVSAINSVGSDSKSITLMFQPQVITPVPFPKSPVITITSPAGSPYSTTVNSVTVSATVLNVESRNAITVIANGVINSGFTYSMSSKVLSFSMNLIAGSNTIVIEAVNAVGNDSKSQTVIYSQPAAQPQPVVTITNPATNPFNTTSNTATVKATVTNVSGASQIAVTVNGTGTGAFTYNAAVQQLTLNTNLIAGANVISVSASNAGGNDSKTTTIIYTEPVAIPAPQITITNPVSSPSNSSVNTAVVNAKVLHVTSSSQISVTLNGSATTAFTFNAASHQLTLNANLIPGANVIVIAATTAGGSDSKTATIIYKEPVAVAVVLAPVVTITNPGSSPFNTTVSTAVINATVANVTSASQVTVTLNGSATTAFAFNAATQQLSYNASLITGANTVVISASTAGGSDSKTATIIYKKPAAVAVTLAPVVTITSPAANPFNTTVNTAVINATVANVTGASQVTVTLNGTSTNAFTFNAAAQQLSYNANLISGSNTIVISASNAGGSDSKTQTIIYTAPAAPVLPPVVSYLTPATTPISATTATYLVSAKVTNITNASEVTVKFNGVFVSSFNYQPLTKKVTFNATLIEGVNKIIITGTNSAGTDSKTTVITYTAPAGTAPDTSGIANPEPGVVPIRHPGNEPPKITMIMPATPTVTTSDAVYQVQAKLEGVVTGAISVTINGVAFTGYNYIVKSKSIFIPVTLNSGNNTVVITVTNGLGTRSETITINKL